jgi:hypothetical protein
LSDLELVDPDVFHLPEDIATLLKTHYGEKFGFVVCIFDPQAGVEPHPIVCVPLILCCRSVVGLCV